VEGGSRRGVLVPSDRALHVLTDTNRGDLGHGPEAEHAGAEAASDAGRAFGGKVALLIAAVEYMADTVERQLAADAARSAGETPGEDVSDLLLRQFTSPIFAAFMEIAAASRTDPVLRYALVEPQKRLDACWRAVATELLGASSDDTDFGMGLELTIRYMRGVASMAMLSEHTVEGHDEVYQEWRRIMAPYFIGSAGTRRRSAPRG
jgi:AcrR family transcriptional regulator